MKIQSLSGFFRLTFASLLTAAVSCSSDAEPRQVKREPATINDGDGSSGSGSKPGVRTTSGNGQSSGDTGSSSSGNNNSSNNNQSNGSSNNNNNNQQQGDMSGSGSVEDRTKAAKDFFELTLGPQLELEASGCKGCHIGPRVPDAQLDGPRGQEEIYVVEVMFERMTDGTSSTANAFYEKVSDSNGDHPGRDRCALNQDICDNIIAFGQLWYEDDGSLEAGAGGLGFLDVDKISAGYQGFINGWAYDAATPDEQFTVEIYNGNADAGTLLVTTEANGQATPLNGATIPPGHEFEVKIPDEMITSGLEMDIHVYALVGGQPVLVGNVKETFYVPSQAGIDFFNNNIAPLVQPNDCGGCHSAGRSLEGTFGSMVTPKPSNGGTATVNAFYLNITGTTNAEYNPNGHPPGNVAGQLGNLMQDWWDLEFGQ
ncbi:MAG: hypothetical protein HRU09_06490 [Oligoflexales bacterium]|nr:hypothetical protein [Oligoflexales bacterium]